MFLVILNPPDICQHLIGVTHCGIFKIPVTNFMSHSVTEISEFQEKVKQDNDAEFVGPGSGLL